MSEAFVRRFAAMTGLALAAAFAVWWLGSVRLAIDRGADAGRSSADALQIVWLVRALSAISAEATCYSVWCVLPCVAGML